MSLLVTGRAVGLALGGAVFGAVIGGALNSWLRVDIVPIGVRSLQTHACAHESTTSTCHLSKRSAMLSDRCVDRNTCKCRGIMDMTILADLPVVHLQGLSSPGVFVSEFAILSLWATCAFLA